MYPGTSTKALDSLLISFFPIDLLKLDINNVNAPKATNCVVNAFVEATPISGPA